jgi:hypothetical protein
MHNFEPITKKIGALSFPLGGFYILRDQVSFSMIRCGKHKDRPAQADNLHLDVWVNGENVLRDSGTYKYNTDKIYSDYFTGTISHNAVSLGEKSQMLRGSRFIWYFWSQALKAKATENDSELSFEGSVSCFRYINKNCIHQRKIRKVKDQLKWIVDDFIDEKEARQNWHFGSELNPNFEAVSKEKAVKETIFDSFDSSYYGNKVNTQSIYFEFENEIHTEININTEK